ncbi:MAG: glycosyltransferase family 9 protein [Fusobacteria bacterium]|nr:glycosyltransferase family 9 protein [Fusobacteriota bacterium]
MKVLFIRFSSIGDIILTTPVLTEFKKKFPDAEVDFLTFTHFQDAISGNKNIDNLICFEKDKYKGFFGIKKFVKENLKNNNYDIVIDLHSKIRSKLISLFLNKKTYTYNKRNFFKTILVKLRLSKYTPCDTIVKRYFNALEKFDIKYSGENLEFNYFFKDKKKVDKYRGSIVLGVGASKETKKWKKEYFSKLSELLNNYYKRDIVIVGSKSEYEEIQFICNENKGYCYNLAGELTLKETAALMSESLFTVVNDSGPFHISRGVKAKTFVIFGATSPKMFDFTNNSTLIYSNEICSPCSLHGDKACPKGHFNCMNNLTPEIVFEKIYRNV